jgi:tetratricopeptide (TPR) repeat protein
MDDGRHALAMDLFRQAYLLQMQGELEIAAELYKRSIEVYPTAEAYTFLGWTYSHQGKTEEAIVQCKNAILIDPTFGNPYNDIGAYLISQGKHEEAIPWLEKATRSERYDAFHYPWYNLARVYLHQEMFTRARECLLKSLKLEPDYLPARTALDRLRILVQ